MTELPSEKLSSREVRDYWIYAKRKGGEYPGHTSRGGKWLIFVSNHNIDNTWIKIKTAVEQGKLGTMAKVATAKKNPDARNSNSKVVCVYTYDWDDERDVKRIREALRNIGIARKISYKADGDTEQGRYYTNGNEKISKYYE